MDDLMLVESTVIDIDTTIQTTLQKIEQNLSQFFISMESTFLKISDSTINVTNIVSNEYSHIETTMIDMSDNVTNMGISLGESLNNEAAPSVRKGADTIISAVDDIGTKSEESTGTLSKIFSKIGDLASGMGEKVKSGLGGIKDGFFDMAKDAIEGNEEYASAMASLEGTVSESFGEAFSGVASLLATDVIPVLTDLAAEYIPQIGEMINTLLPPLSGLIDTVLPMMVDAIGKLFPLIAEIVMQILPVLGEMLPIIGEMLMVLMPPIIQMIEAFLPIVVSLLSLLMPILEVIWLILSPIILAIAEFFTFVAEYILPVLQVVIDFLVVAFTAMLENLSEQLKLGFDFFMGIIRKGKVLLNKVITFIVEKVVNKFTEIKETISSIFEALAEVVSNVWNGIWETIKGIVNSILGGIEGMVNGVVNGINVLLSGIGTVVSAVGDVLGMDWSVSLLSEVSLPRLAKGGVLEKGQIGFLEGDGAEAVVPLEKNKEWISKVSNEFKAQGMGDNRTLSVLEQIASSIYELKNENEILPERMQDAIANGLRFDVDNREFGRMVRKVRMS